MKDVDELIRRVEAALDRYYAYLLGEAAGQTYQKRLQEAARKAEAALDRLFFGPSENLLEAVAAPADALRESTATAVGATYRVTLIRPGWSANGRYYPREVLSRARSLFERVKAFADHPTRQELSDRPERSVRDLVGWYDDVRQEADGRLTARLHLLETATWLRPLLDRRLVGLSVHALGRTRFGEAEGRRGVIVESITRVVSVDVVTESAAGGEIE